MSDDTVGKLLIGVASAAVSGVVTTAVFIATTKMTLDRFKEDAKRIARELKADITGIGQKVSNHQRETARTFKNQGLAIMLGAPEEKESQISHLLKEDC